MEFRFSDDLPIYKQLTDQIKLAIANGCYKAGEKLPSVRDLSSSLRVNPNTIQRALATLENDGLIRTERTSGKFITDDKKVIDKLIQEEKSILMEQIIGELDKMNISNEEIISYIKKNRKEK